MRRWKQGYAQADRSRVFFARPRARCSISPCRPRVSHVASRSVLSAGYAPPAGGKWGSSNDPIANGSARRFQATLAARFFHPQRSPSRLRSNARGRRHATATLLAISCIFSNMATGSISRGRSAAGWRAQGRNCSRTRTPWCPCRCTGCGYGSAASTSRRCSLAQSRPSAVFRFPITFSRAQRRRCRKYGLARSERARNVQGAFTVPKAARIDVKGRKLVVIDDVLTSGATVSACANVLRRAGASRVDVLVLARVVGYE